jgi:hypothetical protein
MVFPTKTGITYHRRNPCVLQRLLPVLYALEFLIALIAVFTVWGEVGGQNHLDYMPWYWKAAIGFGSAAAIIQLTLALASDSPTAPRRKITWTLVLAGLALCAGLVTLYYHVNEPQDEYEDAPATVTPTASCRPATCFHVHCPSRAPSDGGLTRG